MRIANLLPLAALGLCAGLSAQDADRHDTADLRTDAAKLYAKACAGCHLPPDPAFAVDRAWITQLSDTA